LESHDRTEELLSQIVVIPFDNASLSQFDRWTEIDIRHLNRRDGWQPTQEVWLL